jgi:uncharacterized protein
VNTVVPVIEQFYEAIERANPRALLATLTDDFVGRVSEGLPGIGGEHRGPSAMLNEAWIPAHQEYRAVPRPTEVITGDDGTTVVFGRYTGNPPATGTSFDAAFAHLFRLRDGRIAELRQVTDSNRWVTAAAVASRSTAVATQLFDAVRRRDVDLLLDSYADDVVIDDDPSLPYGGTHKGRSGALEHAAGFVATWDRFQDSAARDPGERLLPSGHTVVALWALRASNAGRELSVPATSLVTVERGKVTRLRMLYADSGAVLRFLTGAGLLRSQDPS